MTQATPSRIKTCTFLGSFYRMGQIPDDRRPQIAVAGRSNVGKSSLLNRLVGRKKMAQVSSTPGKTRALNFFLINDAFHLVDLPGYGYARVSREAKDAWGRLLETYLRQSRQLIGLVLLLDSRRDPTPEDRQLLAWLSYRQVPVLIVVTKVDKLNRDQAKRKVAAIEAEFNTSTIGFSSVTGQGKNQLVGAIHSLVQENR